MSPELKAEGLYKKKGNVLRLINKQVAGGLTGSLQALALCHAVLLTLSDCQWQIQ